MNHIILIGFMGAGKTSIGKGLSEKLQWKFIDTDCLIEEQQKKTINDIFADHGENYFRDLETDVLKHLLDAKEQYVVAVGGGLPVREENRRYLKELGTVVYLKADVETLVERLSGDTTRPKLRGGDLREKIETLMRARADIYEDAATLEVYTDHRSLTDVVKEIVEHVL